MKLGISASAPLVTVCIPAYSRAQALSLVHRDRSRVRRPALAILAAVLAFAFASACAIARADDTHAPPDAVHATFHAGPSRVQAPPPRVAGAYAVCRVSAAGALLACGPVIATRGQASRVAP